ncbi:hypothetical protein [Novosphingobium sp. ST904]|uniref:hypothetical protein n=1 Tax=Novosphingobium sp. ST904 TaxID=1684385 RepID=UPI000B2B3B31|nr:hypothetical protein [Novosphingobium sp. ST904]TCM32336.1 hypothetical protein EDF59_12431 [Novosphingobium sp. ST904]
MGGQQKHISLKVSDYYFRLSTEAIRLHSNQNKEFSSLERVVDDRAQAIDSIALQYDPEDMKEHMRLIPSVGNTEFGICILQSSEQSISDAIPKLEKAMGESIAFKDALSLLLFDYIVEANATEVMTKLGMNYKDAKSYRNLLKKRTIM